MKCVGTVLLAAFLSGCAGEEILIRPLPPAGDPATEVTVIRVRSLVQAEWPFYIVVADQPVFDLRNGENTRFAMSSGRQTLTIRCLGGTSSKPYETRIEHDFPPRGAAFFVVEPKNECALVRPVDAGGAVADLRTTRYRPVGTVNRLAQGGDTPAVFSSEPALPLAAAAGAVATPPDANRGVAAASATWVEAFNSRDVARIASLYDAEAVLRDASGQRIAAGPGGIAAYFSGMKTPATTSLGEQDIRVSGDTAVASGASTLGRHNIVYRNRGGKWLIVDHSISAAK